MFSERICAIRQLPNEMLVEFERQKDLNAQGNTGEIGRKCYFTSLGYKTKKSKQMENLEDLRPLVVSLQGP